MHVFTKRDTLIALLVFFLRLNMYQQIDNRLYNYWCEKTSSMTYSDKIIDIFPTIIKQLWLSFDSAFIHQRNDSIVWIDILANKKNGKCTRMETDMNCHRTQQNILDNRAPYVLRL